MDRAPARLAPSELHLRLLERYGPPSLVVTEEHHVVHMSERVGRYLQVTGGEPTADLMRLLKPELRADVRVALHEAARRRKPVETAALRCGIEGQERAVTVTVKPVLHDGDPARGFLLVLFEEGGVGKPGRMPSAVGDGGPSLQLEHELSRLQQQHDDFQNLINSSEVGAIFLDRDLCVKLSTPATRAIFNLREIDAGRPLSDITSHIQYDALHDDARQVLNELKTVDREVETRSGRWYMMRLRPYRTTDDRIDGVVITFHDITERREADRQVRRGEERLRLLIDSAIDYAIFTILPDGTIDTWNAGAQRMFGFTAPEIVGQQFDLLFTPEDRAAGAPTAELARAARDGRAADERFHIRKNGERFYCSGVTTRLDPTGGLGFAKIARDLTEQRKAADALQQAHRTLEQRVQERTRDLQTEILERTSAQEHATSLLRKLVTSQEDERSRIARDLHDQLGQQLTALRLALERLATPGGDYDRQLARAREIANALDADLGFLAWELRPAALDDLGLAAALPRYVKEWSAHYGIAAEYRTGGFQAGQLSRDAETAFYRVAQEALTNVAKHAHASRADVLLECRDGSVLLVVEDDGVGFIPSAPDVGQRGVGLAGLSERAALVGAQLQIEADPGRGTSVFLRCPVVR